MLVELLYEVRAKWYEIGLQLELHSGDLDAIKNSSSDSYLREMLKLWLAENQSPTLKALSTALRTKAVGESRLGLSILSPPLKAGEFTFLPQTNSLLLTFHTSETFVCLE